MYNRQTMMAAFEDELLKEGAHPALEVLKRVATPLATRGTAALHGIPGAVSGVGGAVAGGARGVGGAISRFAQRQRHGLTGWKPAGGLESIRMGKSETREALKKLTGSPVSKATTPATRGHAAMKATPAAPLEPSFFQKLRYGGGRNVPKEVLEKSRERAVSKAREFHEATKAHEDAGLTSIPGWIKGMGNAPIDTLKKGLGREWKSGYMGKAMVGLPVAIAGKELVKGGPDAEGRGRFERTGRALGELGWAMGTPIGAQIMAGKGIRAMAGYMGGKTDSGVGVAKHLKKRKPELGKHPAPPTLESEGQTQPAERIMTPSAMGRPPEDVIS